MAVGKMTVEQILADFEPDRDSLFDDSNDEQAPNPSLNIEETSKPSEKEEIILSSVHVKLGMLAVAATTTLLVGKKIMNATSSLLSKAAGENKDSLNTDEGQEMRQITRLKK